MTLLPRFITHLFMVRKPTITRGILLALFFSVASLIALSYYVSNVHYHSVPRNAPDPDVRCRTLADLTTPRALELRDHSSSASLRIDNKVLVFVETQYSRPGQALVMLLEANRIKFKVELAGKSLPYLTRNDRGKYGVIVFERLDSYIEMDKWNRELLDKYCQEYNVGVIIFTYPTEKPLVNHPVEGFPLNIHTNLALKHYELNPASDVLRIVRAGEVVEETLPGDVNGDGWTIFSPNHSTYQALSYAKTQTGGEIVKLTNNIEEVKHIAVLQDTGKYDGIRRIFFGYGLNFWLHKPLFLDALSFLSHGKFSITLDRYFIVDIDDIFVGKQGIRLRPPDVKAMLSSQERLQNIIPGFHFNLGFSGYYFHAGDYEENLGDDMLLDVKDRFWWFPHMWRHTQPHKYQNVSQLAAEMRVNQHFAKKHGIPVNWSYAVAPHHSGVFPVHEELYQAWREVWGIRATSTEEYPHLRPARKRRGFIHRGIMVLPRQTCGLYTHNLFIDKYPGGREKLEQSIRGGELFETFLYNPVSVFMTHMSNYGNDRLALYTFESEVKFLRCWTNLQLKSMPPLDLARHYFDIFPNEEFPIWRNPCDDKRHLAIWSPQKTCNRLPHFLVIGPQKTGTTALYTFLSMHPNILSNFRSSSTFEEVQFFNGRNYFNGLDWYMDFFPTTNSSNIQLFEKSATYFDSINAPQRSHALLPDAKLITILTNPAKRAYSWYHHMRSHDDEASHTYSFYEVISAPDDAPTAIRDLRNRCLNPGLYQTHLEEWLSYYTSSQLLILDGDELKNDPIAVMDKVQMFLNIEPYLDYSNKLRYNAKKGFYCQVVNGSPSKCLGRSKGRIYPPMEVAAEKFLTNYYRRANVALSKLLNKLDQPIPKWLEEELRDVQ